MPDKQAAARWKGIEMFKLNVGSADRVIRAIIGIVLIAAFFMYPSLGATGKWIALIVGLILLFTAVMSSCPIYRILGMSTRKEG